MGLHAHHPLTDPNKLLNPGLPFAISFVYGENDWMDSRGSRDIVKTNRFFASGESQCYVLPGAGHQLWYGNPSGFIDIVTNDLLGRVSHTYEITKYTTNYVDDQGNFTHNDTEFEELRNAS